MDWDCEGQSQTLLWSSASVSWMWDSGRPRQSSEPGLTLQLEGRERSRGYIVESLPLIGSNYQRWLLSPIIHMTSVDSIPSPPGHHPPHSQCILQVNYQSAQSAHIITRWQVLLVSPPPQADNGSISLTDMVYNKPFAPWKPGDAYSVESDISDLRLLLGSVPDGLQSRWDRNHGA